MASRLGRLSISGLARGLLLTAIMTLDGFAGVPAVAAEPASSATQKRVIEVLTGHCASCHQHGRLAEKTAVENLADILDLERIARDPALVRPGNPDASPLYVTMLRATGAHATIAASPPRSIPSAEEVATIRTWIERLPPTLPCINETVDPTEVNTALEALATSRGLTSSQFRLVRFDHLDRGCLSGDEAASYREAIAGLLRRWRKAGVPGPELLRQITPMLSAVDLAAHGIDAGTWEAAAGVEAAIGGPVSVHSGGFPPLRADRLAVRILGVVPEAFGAAAATGTTRVRGQSALVALFNSYRHAVGAGQVAIELGVPPRTIAAIADAGDGETAVLARRLIYGAVPRAEIEAAYPRLRAAVAEVLDGPLPDASGPGLTAYRAAGAAAIRLEIIADKVSYRVGDRIVLSVRADRPCHLTLIAIDQRGRGTVLFPSDFKPDDRLQAGQVLRVPGPGDGYSLRFAEPGRERFVAVCRPEKGAVDGIRHDFERQRLTDLGNYAVLLSQAYDRRIKGLSDPDPEPAQPRRSRRRRNGGDTPDDTAPDDGAGIAHTGIMVEIE